MVRARNERGAISASLIITILVILLALYEGFQFGPLIISQYQFQDAVIESAKFSRGKEVGEVQQTLLQKAAELQIPISREQILVTRQPTWTRIQVTYNLSAEWLPGQPYTWTVNVDEESVLY